MCSCIECVGDQPEPTFEDLIGAYWELAYKEGKTGESHGDEANHVLHMLRAQLAERDARAENAERDLRALSDKFKRYIDSTKQRITALEAGLREAREALDNSTRHFGIKRLGNSTLADSNARSANHNAIANIDKLWQVLYPKTSA